MPRRIFRMLAVPLLVTAPVVYIAPLAHASTTVTIVNAGEEGPRFIGVIIDYSCDPGPVTQMQVFSLPGGAGIFNSSSTPALVCDGAVHRDDFPIHSFGAQSGDTVTVTAALEDAGGNTVGAATDTETLTLS
ncbi:hypothetical protein [Streptomyces sp. NPDC002671]